MKRISIAFLCISFACLASGQDKKELAEKKAIEKLIRTEMGAFLDKDWELFESCWLQEPYTRHFVTSKNAFNGMIGWENMKTILSQSFHTEGPRGFSSEKTDIEIQVYGNAAYATYLERHVSTDEQNPWRIEAINNAFFIKQKRDGKWKFVCVNIVNTSSFEDARNNRALVEEFLETISGNPKTGEMFARFIAGDKPSLIDLNLSVEQAFPLYELTADEILVEGKRVVVRGRFHGIQHGPYGSIPPSGNEVTLPVVLLYTLENGKISDYTVVYDNASMLRQLGVLE